MWKIIALVIGLVAAGFLIATDTWVFTITAFGYQLTISLVLVILAVLLLTLLWRLIKKPFVWMGRFKAWRTARKELKKEAFLPAVLTTILDQDTTKMSDVLEECKRLYGTNADVTWLLRALFNPTRDTFQKLTLNPKTELAGIRGLLTQTQNSGNLREAGELLIRARQKYPSVPWVQDAAWRLAALQNDWKEAAIIIENMYKKKILDKKEYTQRKACLLYKLGHLEDAYNLMPANPTIAIAYAAFKPKKSIDVLAASWDHQPCWDTYLAFKKAIKKQSPKDQMKQINKMVKKTTAHKLSLLAVADIAMENKLWGAAKENIEIYMQSYPLTEQVALMMANVQRHGWHHVEEAEKWEEKAMTLDNDIGWICGACKHETNEWDVLCPVCNTFDSIRYR